MRLYAATPSATPSAAQTRADFERMAGETPCLEIGSVIYDRPQELYMTKDVNDAKDRERHNKVLAEVADPKSTKDVLLGLLGHADPKVRTLAAMALFDREDPSVLPALVKLAADTASTSTAISLHRPLSAPQRGRSRRSANSPIGWSVYLKASGFDQGMDREFGEDFAEILECPEGPLVLYRLVAVKLARASQGTSPLPNDRVNRVRAVRSLD